MNKKNKVACIIMSVAIGASIPLGINRSLARIREDAAGDYYYDQAGYAIYDGIDNRQAAAKDLISLANRYTEKNPALAGLIDELEYREQASENAWSGGDTFTVEAQANANLDAPAQALADELARTELSEKDQKYPAQIMDRMKSEQDKISRSSYNDRAREFNAKLKRLKPIAVLEPMATFDSPGSVEMAEVTETRDTGTLDEDENLERAADRIGETANRVGDYAGRAEAYADEIAARAEDYAGEITGRTEEYVSGVMNGTEDFIDNILDGIFWADQP